MLAMSGILAGCNSRESLYSQGPWGPRDIRRSYPQYPSPWGSRRPEEPRPLQGDDKTLAGLRPEHRVAGLPADPLPPTNVASIDVDPPVSPEPPQVAQEASRPGFDQAPAPGESPPGVFSAPRRASSYAGTWKAKDGKGNSCLIHLSSAASLDHYKASASKCSSEDLRGVSTWSFDQNRIVLFSRGVEAAHLEGSEAALSGTLSGAGTRLEMSR